MQLVCFDVDFFCVQAVENRLIEQKLVRAKSCLSEMS